MRDRIYFDTQVVEAKLVCLQLALEVGKGLPLVGVLLLSNERLEVIGILYWRWSIACFPSF